MAATINLEDLVGYLDKKKVEAGIKKAFKIDFSYVPKKEEPIVKLNDHVICSTGNFSLIIAPPGSGKSNICEGIAANGINPDCDAFGFEVNSERSLLVDTERTHNDVFRGLQRIKKRAAVDENIISRKLDIVSFVTVDDTSTAKTELEHLMSVGKYNLIIIDGSADFVKSVNDEEESKNFWRWMVAMMNKFSFGVVITIHPNPADPEGKATGHLGSQGQKKAESVFNVIRAESDKMVRILTTELPHGKVRNAADNLTSSFKWDDQTKMFISCDKPTNSKIKSVPDLFRFKEYYTYGELCRAFEDHTGKSRSTAKRAIKDAEEGERIVKRAGFYYLNGSEPEDLRPVDNTGQIEFEGEIMPVNNIDEDEVPF